MWKEHIHDYPDHRKQASAQALEKVCVHELVVLRGSYGYKN